MNVSEASHLDSNILSEFLTNGVYFYFGINNNL